MLRGINLVLVQTEYEYYKFVPAAYRAEHSYEESKGSLPWLLIFPEKVEEQDGVISEKCFLTFEPEPNFSKITDDANGAFKKTTDNKFLEVDFTKIENCLMLEAKNDVYPDGSFNGETEVVAFDEPFADYPDVKAKVVSGIAPLTEDQVQAMIDVCVRQQGNACLAAVLEYLTASENGRKASFNNDFSKDFKIG